MSAKLPNDIWGQILDLVIISLAQAAKIGRVCKWMYTQSYIRGNISFVSKDSGVSLVRHSNITKAYLTGLSCLHDMTQWTRLRKITLLEGHMMDFALLPTSITALTVSDCANAQLEHLTALTCLSMKYCRNSDFSNLTGLKTLNLYRCRQVKIPNLSTLTSLSTSACGIISVDVMQLTNLTQLNTPRINPDFSVLTNITDLSLMHGNISEVAHLPLRKLALLFYPEDAELLQHLRLCKLKLHTDDWKWNNILYKLARLQSLKLIGTGMSIMWNIIGSLQITSFAISKTSGYGGDARYITSVTKLSIKNAPNEQVRNLGTLTQLKSLTLQYTPFDHRDISQMTSLTYLKISTSADGSADINLSHHSCLRKIDITLCDNNVILPQGISKVQQ